MVLLLATGNGRCAAPFFFLSRGVTTIAMVVSLPAAVAHAKFTFCDFVHVSGEGNVLVAAVYREFAATRQWWFSFSHGGSRSRPRLRFRAAACREREREREREEKCTARGRRRGAREFCALIKLYGLSSINNRGI